MRLSLKSKWLVNRVHTQSGDKNFCKTLGEIKQGLLIYRSHGLQQAVNSITIWSQWTGSCEDAKLIIVWIGQITRNVSKDGWVTVAFHIISMLRNCQISALYKGDRRFKSGHFCEHIFSFHPGISYISIPSFYVGLFVTCLSKYIKFLITK